MIYFVVLYPLNRKLVETTAVKAHIDKLHKEDSVRKKANTEKMLDIFNNNISKEFDKIKTSLNPEERNLNADTLKDILTNAFTNTMKNTSYIDSSTAEDICLSIINSLVQNLAKEIHVEECQNEQGANNIEPKKLEEKNTSPETLIEDSAQCEVTNKQVDKTLK